MQTNGIKQPRKESFWGQLWSRFDSFDFYLNLQCAETCVTCSVPRTYPLDFKEHQTL